MQAARSSEAETPANGTGAEAASASVLEIDGVYPQLGMLPPETVISQKGLATIFRKTPKTIQRWVEERQLPQPIPLGEDRSWLNEAIVNHLRKRHEKAERDRDRAERAPT